MKSVLNGTLLAVLLGCSLVSADPSKAATDLDKSQLARPSDGGVRRWQVSEQQVVELRENPSGASDVVSSAQSGAILANFGCADRSGALWCEVRPLHGGPKGFVPAEHLQPVAGPDGIVAMGPNDTAKRAKRRKFDATGEVPCAQEQGETLAPCPIGLARSTGGDVTAAVTFASGFTRLLFFMHGEFVFAAATMSGAGRDTDWEVRDGVHFIRADDQQFEIPDALLFNK